MSSLLHVFAPVAGKVTPITQVPDPVFSERMLGDGIALDPQEGVICAPFDGKVITVNKGLHAVVLGTDGFELLIHVGLETVNLKGQGFKTFIKDGDTVKKGQKLLEFDRAFIAQNAPSSLVIMVVTAPMESKISPTTAIDVKTGDSLFSIGQEAVPTNTSTATQSLDTPVFTSETLTIINPNGLHARPAGVLAQAAAAYPFDIFIDKNGQQMSAKSIVGIMSLSLERGAQITLCAHTQDKSAANAALSALSALIAQGLGEKATPACNIETPCLCVKNTCVDFTKPAAVKALTACAGIAQGTVFHFSVGEITFEENAPSKEKETQHLNCVITQLGKDLEQEIATAKTPSAKEILQAHLEILKDPMLLDQAHKTILLGKSASFGFNEAVRHSIDLIKKTNNRFLMERISDFKDLRKRVLLKISGKTETAPQFPTNCILVAEDLLPSDLAFFNENIAGVVLAQCSPTAHTAIMLRNMGVPSLVAAGDCVLDSPENAPAVVDATQGTFYVNPDEPLRKKLESHIIAAQEQAKKNQEQSGQPALTQDGIRIILGGNVSNEKEALFAYHNGADALGLVRTEFLFFQGDKAPSQEEQFNLYQNIANALHGRPITLRTLDVGGDKPVEYIKIPSEENPIVGLRGVRNYEDNKEVFLSQIRAMLRVEPAGVVRIMLPMISFVDEMQYYRQIIEQEKDALGIKTPVEIGMMIEVPAAALMAKQFAKYADFFSLGTNDLTQYTLAIDRGHKTLSARADSLNPGVLQLIEATCRGADEYHRETAVCGAMAGDLSAIPLLIGYGVRELAVAASSVAQIKALIRTLDVKKCRQAALHALSLASAAEVREFVKQTFHI